MREDRKLNLNGEFLGVTSLAVYSAPWYLQLPLILLVGLMFLFKLIGDSRSLRQRINTRASGEEDEGYEAMLEEVNRIFFGLTVVRSNLPVYWMGTLIFVITLIYSLYNCIAHLLG